MSPAVREADHRAWLEDQLRDILFLRVEQFIGVQELQIILDRQIQEGVEAILATFFGDLRHGLPDQRFHRWVSYFVYDTPFPFAAEYLGHFHLFAERRPEALITGEFLLFLHGALEGGVPA